LPDREFRIFSRLSFGFGKQSWLWRIYGNTNYGKTTQQAANQPRQPKQSNAIAPFNISPANRRLAREFDAIVNAIAHARRQSNGWRRRTKHKRHGRDSRLG
jgi:hypothetical protein